MSLTIPTFIPWLRKLDMILRVDLSTEDITKHKKYNKIKTLIEIEQMNALV